MAFVCEFDIIIVVILPSRCLCLDTLLSRVTHPIPFFMLQDVKYVIDWIDILMDFWVQCPNYINLWWHSLVVNVFPGDIKYRLPLRVLNHESRLCFYQTRSAWSMDQGSNRKHSAVHNFAPTVTKFCVMWEGQALPHDTKFSNCRCEIVSRRVIFIWSLIPGSSWSGLIKAEPGRMVINCTLATMEPKSKQRWALRANSIVAH